MVSSEVQVRMKFEDDLVGMRIQHVAQEKIIRDYLFSGFNEMKREHVGHDYRLASFSPIRDHGPSLYTNHNTEIRQYFDRSVLIDPTIKTDVTQIEGKYLNALKLSEEDSSDLAKRTAEIYETKPSWEFLPHQDFPPDNPSRFAILEGNRRMFFDNFGDGLHYGLAILAIAKTRTNTALFIEEIESHQHPEAIKNLVSNLLDIAKLNDLQLFITTHNDYARDYLHYYYKNEEERNKEFRCFHVIRNKDTGEVEAKIEKGIVNITEDLHGRPS
jgi:predicted ATPase